MSQVPTPPVGGEPPPPFNLEEVKSKKMVAGLLGILAGSLGAHRFYLGDTTGGIIRILLCCVPIGLIEGIIYLTKPEQDFYQIYMVEKKKWF
jgi:TM2 domain-containing membrane protein YozV